MKLITTFRNFIFNVLTFLAFSKFKLSHCEDLTSKHLISGGLPHDEHNYGKYVVSIQYKILHEFGYHHFCGGTIISSRKILTAAHCAYNKEGDIKNPGDLVVVVGMKKRFVSSETTRFHDVIQITVNEGYKDGKTLANDVAIFTVKIEIEFNDAVGEIDICTNTPDTYSLCTIAGFGRLFFRGPSSDRLLFVDVRVMHTSSCKRIYKSAFTKGMMCAGFPGDWQRDSCSGDSGGPLICNEAVCGIVSWGFRCGTPHLPGVYTDVSYFKDFIRNNAWSFRLNSCIIVKVLFNSVLIKRILWSNKNIF